MKKTRREKTTQTFLYLLTFLSGPDTKGQGLTSPFGNSLKKSAHIAGVPSLLQEHGYPPVLTSSQPSTECPAREQIETKQNSPGLQDLVLGDRGSEPPTQTEAA